MEEQWQEHMEECKVGDVSGVAAVKTCGSACGSICFSLVLQPKRQAESYTKRERQAETRMKKERQERQHILQPVMTMPPNCLMLLYMLVVISPSCLMLFAGQWHQRGGQAPLCER